MDNRALKLMPDVHPAQERQAWELMREQSAILVMTGYLPEDVSECRSCGVPIAGAYSRYCSFHEPKRDRNGRFVAKPKPAPVEVAPEDENDDDESEPS